MFTAPVIRKIALFAGLAMLVMLVSVLYIDLPLSLALRGAPDYLIAPFKAITFLGKSEWYLVPSGVVFLLALYFIKRQPQARRVAIYSGFIFANVAGSGIAVNIAKVLIGRARPVLEQRFGFYGFDPLTLNGDWHSLPSGHTNTVFALALAVGALWPKWRWPMLVFAVVIACSRVIGNSHYLTDILAGGLLAFITFYPIKAYFMRQGWLR